MKRNIFFFLMLIALFVTMLFATGCDTTALSFSAPTYTVQVGTSFAPNIQIKPKNNVYEINSENAVIVSAQNNVVTANREGTATITVTSGKLSAKATVYCVKDEVVDPIDARVVKTHTVFFEIVNYAEAGLETGYLQSVYAYDGSILNVNVPTVTGYHTDGWYTDRDCTQKYDIDLAVKTSFTLYAHLTALETDYAVQNNLVTGLLYKNLPHEELILPESSNGAPVYGIADEAFIGDEGIKRVVLPASYRTIGTSAFAGCVNLEEVVVPEGCALTTIGANAFGVLRDDYGVIVDSSCCAKLTSLRLPDTVTRVGAFAFYNCAGLVLDGIPDGLTSIEQYAFAGTKINDVSLANVVKIEEGAFYTCADLDTVTDTASVGSCGKLAFYGTKLSLDSRAAYNSSPKGQEDDKAAYYAGTILYGCYERYGTGFGKGKIHVKEGTTLIADEAFNDRYQRELTLYLETDSARNALNRDFLGKDVFYSSDGVFLVVPSDLVAAYKDRYGATNEGRDYTDKIVCAEVVEVEGNVDTVNFGVHHLLKKTDSSGSSYYYDYYEGGENGTASIIRLDELPVAYDVVRINMGGFNGISTLRILGVGRVATIAYLGVANCGKTTVKEIRDGVEKDVEKNIFTRMEFTKTVSPTILENDNSVQFSGMPELYAYVKSSDLLGYRDAWAGRTVALQKLRDE